MSMDDVVVVLAPLHRTWPMSANHPAEGRLEDDLQRRRTELSEHAEQLHGLTSALAG